MERHVKGCYGSGLLWTISLDLRDPIGTLSAEGNGCEVLRTPQGMQAVLRLPFGRHRLVAVTKQGATVYSGPAMIPTYSRIEKFTLRLSNPAFPLVNKGEGVAI